MIKLHTPPMVLTATLAGVVLAILIIVPVAWLAPYLLYAVKSPAPETACEKIRPGMDVAEALAISDASTPPLDEGYGANILFFSREAGTCQIHFEIDGTRVSTVQFVTRSKSTVVE
jgi:hypothetical protein